MTFATRETTGISRQRSYWLRCFLGVTWSSIALGVASSGGVAHAQATYDCFYVKTAKVAHIRGLVLDQHGTPIAGAQIELLKKGANDAVANTQSDAKGSFQFDAPAGPYWVHAKADGFQTTGLSVRVDHGLFSFFNTRRLYVVLPAGAGPQPCPAEITSKKTLQEYVKHNAAQK
jgi:hypothetical protein